MKKSVRILFSALLAGCLLFLLSGCGSDQLQYLQYNEDGSVVMPEEGEEVAVMHVTGYGDITIRLFPEQAPKAVENFTELAKSGYYDGLTFHRVIQHFMIQGGDPRGDGTGGQSIYGEAFKDEFDNSLCNFVGALSMANAGPNTNGSQYFINEDSYYILEDEFFDTLIDYSKNTRGYGRESFSEELRALYQKVGGNPLLDGVHTVFGQVVDGMDIVHQIAALPTHTDDATGQTDIPDENVIVESISIEEYHAN